MRGPSGTGPGRAGDRFALAGVVEELGQQLDRATSSATAGQPATTRPTRSTAPTATFVATLATVLATSAAHGSTPARVRVGTVLVAADRGNNLHGQPLEDARLGARLKAGTNTGGKPGTNAGTNSER
jgi:hypothetical protein